MVKYIATAIFTNGTTKTSRLFSTEQALSNWANRQYRKDNRVTVEAYTLDKESFEFKHYATFHE